MNLIPNFERIAFGDNADELIYLHDQSHVQLTGQLANEAMKAVHKIVEFVIQDGDSNQHCFFDKARRKEVLKVVDDYRLEMK